MILSFIIHQQSDMVERVSRELARILRTFLSAQQHNKWFSQIENIETIINETPYETAEITPYKAMWGRKPPRWWEKLILKVPQEERMERQKQKRITRERIKSKREVGERVLERACKVSNTQTGTVGESLALYEGP